ncbi:Uncharacterized protein TCAP_04606 [Tolypocladium capitatum]|uniref:Uncharacterized protein n=1 Tax=Tolypocladium capitatum TaxID=45235 RepID=A0A2K3QD52_9HYPO|nr:Uncharacterized protein TCAP_04606 [Tolypocladium capitatum]
MDDPNNGGNDPRTMSRAEYARNVKAAIDEKRQRALQNRQQFEPIVREQIQRLFQDYEAPFYARARGFGRTQTLALAESTISSLAAANGRRFSDTETQALTEHFVSSIHTMLVWKWTMTGLAVYMTYRGRSTWRFPFFKPKMDGRLNPVTGSPQVKFMWHSARFAAYYGAIWMFGEPVFQGANFMRYRAAMEQDPRLTTLMRDGKARAQEISDQAIPGSQHGSSSSQDGDAWRSESEHDRPAQQDMDGAISIPAQAKPGWNMYRQPQPSKAPPSRDSWNVPSGGFDDASPVSSAGQQSSPANYSGSAWDRVRQQSQYQPRQTSQQGQQTWEAPQSTSGWGSTDDDASPQYRDGYSFSSADEEKALAKSQAQKDFDEMLDRERRGVDQERSSWRGR